MTRTALPQRGNRVSIVIVLVLMVTAFAMAVLGFSGQRTPQELWDSVFASAEDGSWKAIAFDGRPVAPRNYLVAIRRGDVIGGSDDCNGWSFQDEEPDSKGERMIISTAQECPGDELRGIYWVLVHAPKIEQLSDRTLRLSRAGHHGLFRRCRPDRRQNRCEPV